MKDLLGRTEWHPKRMEERLAPDARKSTYNFLPSARAVEEGNIWARQLADSILTVIREGLKLGDELVFSWVNDTELPIKGCQLQAKRRGVVLKWAEQGFGRDPSGKWVYLPYIRTKRQMIDLAIMLTQLTGYEFRVVKENRFFLTLELFPPIAEARRLVLGDLIGFYRGGEFSVTRSQGTIDLNLYRPELDDKTGFVYQSTVDWLDGATHHFQSFCRLLTEINGFRCSPASGGFRVAK